MPPQQLQQGLEQGGDHAGGGLTLGDTPGPHCCTGSAPAPSVLSDGLEIWWCQPLRANPHPPQERNPQGKVFKVMLASDRSHYWRRRWHPTPVFLPGESQGQGA